MSKIMAIIVLDTTQSTKQIHDKIRERLDHQLGEVVAAQLRVFDFNITHPESPFPDSIEEVVADMVKKMRLSY